MMNFRTKAARGTRFFYWIFVCACGIINKIGFLCPKNTDIRRLNVFDSKLKNEQTDLLFEAILSLNSQEECYRLFEDLCTIHEIQALAQRLEVAKLLRERITTEIFAK